MFDKISKLIWGIAIIMIFASSIYYSFKLKFPQLRFIELFKSLKDEKKDKDKISSKDTLLMSLASKIGAGSLAGIAFAIFYGGIGTIFWMWISSFFASINCFIENILSTIYKEKDGLYNKSGPAYYIKKGLNKKNLAILYSVLAISAYIIGFISIQNNTIVTLTNDMYSVNKIIISLVVTILSSIIIIKGIKTISNICNKIVPIMSMLYLILGLIVISLNITKVPSIILNIIKSAFDSKAISGGIIYTLIIGMQKGIFASEAGVGTSAISSGATSNKDYKKQGYIGIIETYFISLFITTMTAFIIILTPFNNFNRANINGIELTKYAFSYHFGHFGEVMLLIILILFSFSTIITVYYYGESNLKFLTKNKLLVKILKIITIISLFTGGIISSTYIWSIVDIFVALLAIINIYALFNLKDKVIEKLK